MVSVRTTDNAVERDTDIAGNSCDGDLTGKLCIGAIEKKVRNLEKRKTRLDGYRQKLSDGEKLAKEQMEALEKYEVLCSNLDFAREVHKQILNVVAETGTVKLQNSRSKSPHLSSNCGLGLQEAEEIVMLQTILRITNSRQARLLKAPSILQMEEVSSLQEFGSLISICDDFSHDQLQSAAAHLCKYVNREDMAVGGATYNRIYELVHKIVENIHSISHPRNSSQKHQSEDSIKEMNVSGNKNSDSELSSDEGGYPEKVDPQIFCSKSLQDILKGMEGEFTFLQESEIYKDVPKPVFQEETQENESLDRVETTVTSTATATVMDVNDAFAVGAHPMNNALFLPKLVTIPFSNTIYAPSNTLPVTHHYTVPAFTSYDYNIQNPVSFQTMFPHAIINGTTYFHQPGAVYATHQATPDPFNVAQIEEYTDPTEMGASAEVYYPSQFDLNIQEPAYPTPEEQESEFEMPDEVLPELSPLITTSQLQQPSDETATETSPPAPHKIWQYSNRGRGGRASYRGQRNFLNQSRYHKGRAESDQMGGYRGQPRTPRFHNGNSFHQE